MIIALIICLPITALVVGFLVLKAVQLGLKWQIQVEQKQEPTMEIPNPIQQFTQPKAVIPNNAVLDEWLNGPKEER